MSEGFGRRRIAVGCAVLVAALAAGPAAGEGPEEKNAKKDAKKDEWIAKWSNGFKVEKGKSFQLKFGGRIQADYTFADADAAVENAFGAANFEDGFEFRRARLFVSGTIYDRVEFKAQYDFVGGAELKDVWIALKHDWGKLKFGHYKEPFSLEEQTSSKYLAFLERSLPVEAFSPSRNSGIGVEGKRGDRLDWGLGYFYDSDDFGQSTDEDRTNLTGRVVYRPVYEDCADKPEGCRKGEELFHVGLSVTRKELETGGSFRFRARPENHLTTRLVNTGNFAADSALVYGLELAGVMDRFWFAGEVIVNDVDAPAAGDPSFDGFYAQAGYFLTGDYRRYKTSSGAFDRQKPSSVWDASGGSGAWEIAVRFSSIDLTDQGVVGGEQDDITVGVNWYPNPATRMMINYVMADRDGIGDANFLMLRWQVDF